MNFSLLTLTLQFRTGREVIAFSPQINFFYGPTSGGKSSIARIIDFCLGNDLVEVPALRQEFVSAELRARISTNHVIFERSADQKSSIGVAWTTQFGEVNAVNAPISPIKDGPAIWGSNLFTFSDLLFHLMDLEPVRVRRSKTQDDSPLIRLSFRDLWWYCYLRQDRLDSSFFFLGNDDDTFKRQKSRDVMRYLVGFYTNRINELEEEIEDAAQKRRENQRAANQLRTFLTDFGIADETQLASQLVVVEERIEQLKRDVESVRSGITRQNAHIVDELRNELRSMSKQLSDATESLASLSVVIEEQTSLRAELISAKFKSARAVKAAAILSHAQFELCPACGEHLKVPSEQTRCSLCGSEEKHSHADPVADEVMRRDLMARIDELDQSIRLHKQAERRQRKYVEQLRSEKTELDWRLSEENKQYDSILLSAIRDYERKIAENVERRRHLEQMRKMPSAVSQLEDEVDKLSARETELKRALEREKQGVNNAWKYRKEIQDCFLEAILETQIPGVTSQDTVELNMKSWLPSILSAGDEFLSWNFQSAGAGGKQVLFKICYALAIHRVATENNLPLPQLLIIDSPKKNLAGTANAELVSRFYRYLYRLAAGPLSTCQFVVMDSDYEPPDQRLPLEVVSRLMKPKDPNDPAFPPLVPGYDGP